MKKEFCLHVEDFNPRSLSHYHTCLLEWWQTSNKEVKQLVKPGQLVFFKFAHCWGCVVAPPPTPSSSNAAEVASFLCIILQATSASEFKVEHQAIL